MDFAIETIESKKPLRLFFDGSFDVMHYGHMNALRQARNLGAYLIVGINCDASITECKGRPVMNEAERTAAVSACRWADEIVPNVPYVMNEDYLNFIIQTYKVDFVVHGDDPCLVDGKDVYESAKNAGKFASIPRTQGISTTDILGRILRYAATQHEGVIAPGGVSPTSGVVAPKFAVTSWKLRQFGTGVKCPTTAKKVVYAVGVWDMCHAGHFEFLKAAKENGDYLLVGVLNDENSRKLKQYGTDTLPILTMLERAMSLLGCKFVDDVLLDAPEHITPELLATFNVKAVVRNEKSSFAVDSDLYAAPQRLGILKQVNINAFNSLSSNAIIERVLREEKRYETKYNKKIVSENAYYAQKFAAQNE